MRCAVRRLVTALAFLGAFVGSTALAQGRVTPSREQLDPRQDQARPPPDPGAGVPGPPSSRCAFAGSDISFDLQSVEITGSTASPEALRGAYAPYVGRRIPVASICEIRDRFSAVLFAQGRLARVEAPEQTI